MMIVASASRRLFPLDVDAPLGIVRINRRDNEIIDRIANAQRSIANHCNPMIALANNRMHADRPEFVQFLQLSLVLFS